MVLDAYEMYQYDIFATRMTSAIEKLFQYPSCPQEMSYFVYA